MNAKTTAWLSDGTGLTLGGVSDIGGWKAGTVYRTGDVNGDGLTDLIQIWTPNDVNAKATMWISNGNTLVLGPVSDIGGWGSGRQHEAVDSNGDGLTDIVELWPNGGVANATPWLSSQSSRDAVTRIADGLGASTQIAYSTPAAQYGAGYTKGTSSYPRMTVTPSWPVVTDATSVDSANVSKATRYFYDSATVEFGTGRGFLGFQATQSQDVTTGLVDKTIWRLDFPYTGLPAQSARGTSPAEWSNLGITAYAYDCIDYVSATGCDPQPGRRYFAYQSLATSTGNRDITATGAAGAGLPGKRTTQSMDGWGNLTSVAVQTLNPDGSASGYSETTTNVYGNDVGKWLLGRLLKSTTVTVAP